VTTLGTEGSCQGGGQSPIRARPSPRALLRFARARTQLVLPMLNRPTSEYQCSESWGLALPSSSARGAGAAANCPKMFLIRAQGFRSSRSSASDTARCIDAGTGVPTVVYTLQRSLAQTPARLASGMLPWIRLSTALLVDSSDR
jgi:hypothetical protein